MTPNGPDRQLKATGVGLRGPHVPRILSEQPAVPWFELLTDNHLADGGPLKFQVDVIAERYPVTLHGVGMSLGSVDPLDRGYIRRVRDLARRIGAVHISEHIAFSSVAGAHSHDLLPLPWTDEALKHLVGRVRSAQEELGERILLENISTYIEYDEADFSEGQFISALCAETGCGLLLDINNVYVNAVNHDRDPMELLDEIPWRSVGEIHLAGHDRRGDLLIDTHGQHVAEPVLELFESVVGRAAGVPVLLEWDTQLPDWETLWCEAQRIESVRRRNLDRRAA
jgi:uncharacterized protein (UPF0276 family)